VGPELGHVVAGHAFLDAVEAVPFGTGPYSLGLNESFGGGEPAYLFVPAELEREAALAQYRWIGSRAMGWLHIARLDYGADVPLWPVDVAVWQREGVDEAMSLLHDSNRNLSIRAVEYPAANHR
jgi:hypothetical protein